MGNLIARRPLLLSSAAAAAVVMLGAAGAALANEESPAPVIHACVARATGSVRIASRCTARETPLTWNQQGPAGPPGRGVPGQQGSPGPSHAWFYAGGSGEPIDPGDAETLLADGTAGAVQLAPGLSYAASAFVTLSDPGGVGASANCTLQLAVNGTPAAGSLTDTESTSLGSFREGPIDLSVAGTPGTSVFPELSCAVDEFGDPLTVVHWTVTITQVGTLSQVP